MRGTIKYESLINGAVDLIDLQRLNDSITAADENDMRLDEWRRRNV